MCVPLVFDGGGGKSALLEVGVEAVEVIDLPGERESCAVAGWDGGAGGIRDAEVGASGELELDEPGFFDVDR